MNKGINRLASAGVVFALLLMSSGCASLEPWQRGALAQPGMDFVDDPLLSAYQQHVEFSKEAATGDAGLAGSGCGCN